MASKLDVDLSECRSYTTFTESLKYHRGNTERINKLARSAPIEKRLDKDASSHTLRGSFISIMGTWEKYVKDILKETVETVFECIARNDSAQVALAQSSSQDIFRKAIAHHVVHDKQDAPGVEKKTKRKIANLSKREVSTVEMSVDLLVQPDLWKNVLVTYKQSLLGRCDCKVYPFFSGDDGIDSKFKSLFETASSLSEIVVEMGPIKYRFRNIVKRNDEPIELATSQSINDLLRLYYGARCAFAHGGNEKTFQPGGALHDFPTKEVFQERIGKGPADLLYSIYKNARDYGDTAWVFYNNLVNLQRSIRAIAFRLFGAISKWVYDSFGACIWNFDPDKLKSQAGNEQELVDVEKESVPGPTRVQSDGNLQPHPRCVPPSDRRQSTATCVVPDKFSSKFGIDQECVDREEEPVPVLTQPKRVQSVGLIQPPPILHFPPSDRRQTTSCNIS